MTIAIRVEHLGKKYLLRHQRPGQRYKALRDVIADRVNRLVAPQAHAGSSSVEEFWALKDVSFEIKQGEAVGIIGRNGAGKSTLLKILSRITEPAEGRVELEGKVASLLEVGTGFHPELTGRENIFLNGSIMGLGRAGIKKKFDEIVAFAEVEKFLDTPVKRYSSGMYVRLAFAVAAHLEPDILIVDEVLAVGDLRFQKKCLGKMQSVAAGEGRTVLFVSHNLGVVANLCTRVIMLRDGKLLAQGDPNAVISEYISEGAALTGEATWEENPVAQNAGLAIRAARIVSGGKTTADVAIDQPMVLEIEVEAFRKVTHLSSSIHLFDKQGVWVLCSGTRSETLDSGRVLHRYHFPANFFNDGRYHFTLFLVRDATHIEITLPEAVAFFVHETGVGREEYGGAIGGCVRPLLQVESTPLTP